MRLAGTYGSMAWVPPGWVGAYADPTCRAGNHQLLSARAAAVLAVAHSGRVCRRAARRGAAGVPAGPYLPGQRAVPAVRPAVHCRTLVSGLAAHQRLLTAAHPAGADPQPHRGSVRAAPAPRHAPPAVLHADALLRSNLALP